jgi:MFS family permease
MIILGGGMWVITIPAWLVIRDTPEKSGYVPDGIILKGEIGGISREPGGQDLYLGPYLKRKSFYFLNTVEFVRSMASAAVAMHIMPYLGSVGITRSTSGLAASAVPLVSIVGRFGFGWLSDALDKRYTMGIALAITASGLFAFCQVDGKWIMFVFLFLYSTGFGGGNALRGILLREYFGTRSFGKMIGMIMGSAAVGGIVGPILAGWVFDNLGSYHLVWLGFSGLVVLSIALLAGVR